jgi:hypothetical protein
VAVLDPAWLAVWWPWLLVWVTTVVLLVIAVGIVLVYRRKERRALAPLGVCIYLDESSVMNLYRQHGGKYRAALEHEVQERISSGRELEASGELANLMARARGEEKSEVFRTYVEKAEAITVIGMIVEVLARADDIVDIDLPRQQVKASAALGNALHHEQPAGRVRLQDVGGFVSIRGRFREVARNADTVTFEAPVGDPAAGAAASKVRIVCAAAGLHRGVRPSGHPRCLGLIGEWDAGAQSLDVHPIAVFR